MIRRQKEEEMGERGKESGGGNEEGIKGEKEEGSRLPQSSSTSCFQ